MRRSRAARKQSSRTYQIEGTRHSTIYQGKQRAVVADIDYIAQNRITLLRTGAMDADTIESEKSRLEAKLAVVNEEIKVYAESAPEMLKCIITFSELVKNAGLYYRHALDNERREIVTMVFSELIFKERELLAYQARDGFGALLSRASAAAAVVTPLKYGKYRKKEGIGLPGSPLFRTLETMCPLVRSSMQKMKQPAVPSTARDSARLSLGLGLSRAKDGECDQLAHLHGME